tara:strand:+ start:2664 stop:3641 length:978 start_codon:yes stop_codon:yes gene_type:complete
MKKNIGTLLRKLDQFTNNLYLRISDEKNILLSFMFHAINIDEKIKINELINPLLVCNINDLKIIIEYLLYNKYVFITPDDYLKGKKHSKRYVTLTFDDGYYNNIAALTVLKEYGIPAVFFISTKYVLEKKAFWWDIIYRERMKRGTTIQLIANEISQQKNKNVIDIEKYITNEYGDKSLKPISDIDRPFTSSELKQFSKENYVHIGNHTFSHTVLTICSDTQVKDEMLRAQNDLKMITGIKPTTISFPNGDYSDNILNITKQIGFHSVFTTKGEKNKINNYLKSSPFIINRKYINPTIDPIYQIDMCRSGISKVYPFVKGILQNL